MLMCALETVHKGSVLTCFYFASNFEKSCLLKNAFVTFNTESYALLFGNSFISLTVILLYLYYILSPLTL